jgi:hypothetical protein
LRREIESDPIKSAWFAFEHAAGELERAWAAVGKLESDKTESGLKKGVEQEDYKAALSLVDAKRQAMFGWLDRARHLELHKDDPPTEPLVPEEDVRAVVGASLSDKMDEVQFTVNYGILGSKIAHAIRMDVDEGESLDVPYCQDCE